MLQNVIFFMEPRRGLEPPTNGLQNRCSAIELPRHVRTFLIIVMKSVNAHFSRSTSFYACRNLLIFLYSIGYGSCSGSVAFRIGQSPPFL